MTIPGVAFGLLDEFERLRMLLLRRSEFRIRFFSQPRRVKVESNSHKSDCIRLGSRSLEAWVSKKDPRVFKLVIRE